MKEKIIRKYAKSIITDEMHRAKVTLKRPNFKFKITIKSFGKNPENGGIAAILKMLTTPTIVIVEDSLRFLEAKTKLVLEGTISGTSAIMEKE